MPARPDPVSACMHTLVSVAASGRCSSGARVAYATTHRRHVAAGTREDGIPHKELREPQVIGSASSIRHIKRRCPRRTNKLKLMKEQLARIVRIVSCFRFLAGPERRRRSARSSGQSPESALHLECRYHYTVSQLTKSPFVQSIKCESEKCELLTRLTVRPRYGAFAVCVSPIPYRRPIGDRVG